MFYQHCLSNVIIFKVKTLEVVALIEQGETDVVLIRDKKKRLV